MPYRYENVSGQVVESEHQLEHLEGLARWTRTVVELSAPAETVDADAVVVRATETVDSAATGLADAHVEAAETLAELKSELAAEDKTPQAVETLNSELAEILHPKPTGTGQDDRDEWIAYALANGKTADELKGVKTKTIAAWFA
ncbi:hypothetical protein [Rhodococcoides fascians]|uniref:hypothetical protein n=1 Tax=Rhodococcoides fascians TaxID=1828 RepID=UPI0005627ED6|nr:hypothetical protein [Rhodococcus fascians]